MLVVETKKGKITPDQKKITEKLDNNNEYHFKTNF